MFNLAGHRMTGLAGQALAKLGENRGCCCDLIRYRFWLPSHFLVIIKKPRFLPQTTNRSIFSSLKKGIDFASPSSPHGGPHYSRSA